MVERHQQGSTATTIFDWRFEELRRAGYSFRQAWVLAGARQVDVREAARLLAHGCPPVTALRILI